MDQVWRWNVDAVWTHFSWMYEEAYIAEESIEKFVRYHHISSCLYFGFGCLEAFLNQQTRKRFRNVHSEDSIFRMLRKTQFRDKLTKWPSVYCGAEVPIPSPILEALEILYELRGEVTHQKKRDHSLFSDLDDAKPMQFIENVTLYLVTVHHMLNTPFPYWLLGWNYIGMNNDPHALFLSNNQQFMHSLRSFGEDIPAWEYDAANAWEKANMSTPEGFQTLKRKLCEKGTDIEPFDARFPQKPRLCRKWWNRSRSKKD